MVEQAGSFKTTILSYNGQVPGRIQSQNRLIKKAGKAILELLSVRIIANPRLSVSCAAKCQLCQLTIVPATCMLF